MIRIAVRETLVLLLGYLLSCAGALVAGNAAENVKTLAAAILVPIAFALGRAALVRRPLRHLSWVRRASYQIVIGMAISLLLIFEMGTEMFVGAADIPLAAWAVVTASGVAYVLLFCLAQQLGFNGDLRAF